MRWRVSFVDAVQDDSLSSFQAVMEGMKTGDEVIVVDHVINTSNGVVRFGDLMKHAFETGVKVNGGGVMVNGSCLMADDAPFVSIQGVLEAEMENFTFHSFSCPILHANGTHNLRMSEITLQSCHANDGIAMLTIEGGRADVDNLTVTHSIVHDTPIVKCDASNVNLRKTVLENIFASHTGPTPLFLIVSSNVTLESCQIGRVTSPTSSFICANANSRLMIRDVLFQSNQNRAIVLGEAVDVTIEQCIFEDNMACILDSFKSTAMISDCLFQRNFAPFSTILNFRESKLNASVRNAWIGNSGSTLVNLGSNSVVTSVHEKFSDNKPHSHIFEVSNGSVIILDAGEFDGNCVGNSVIGATNSHVNVTSSSFDQLKSVAVTSLNSQLMLSGCSFTSKFLNKPIINANGSLCLIADSQFKVNSYSHVLQFASRTDLTLSGLTFSSDRRTALDPKIARQCRDCSFGEFTAPPTPVNWPVIILLSANVVFMIFILFRFRRNVTRMTRRFLGRKFFL